MPTPAELLNEISNGPLAATLAPLVAGGEWQAVADALNAKSYRGLVPIRELSAYCIAQGVTGAVLALDALDIGQEIAPGVPMTLQTKGLLKTVLTLLLNDFRLEEVDVDDAGFGAAMDGLMALGVLTQHQKDAVLALGANRYSRIQVAFGWDAPTASAFSVRAAVRN